MLKSRLASPPSTKALWSPPRGWSCPTSPSRPPLQSPLWLALAGASTRYKSWLGKKIHLNLSLDDGELEQAVGQERPDQGCHWDSACTFGVATFVWGSAAFLWFTSRILVSWGFRILNPENLKIVIFKDLRILNPENFRCWNYKDLGSSNP